MDRFSGTRLAARRILFAPGRPIEIRDPEGGVRGRARLKFLPRAEELTVFAAADTPEPILFIRSVPSAEAAVAWDVRRAGTGDSLGTLRRMRRAVLTGSEWLLTDHETGSAARMHERTRLGALAGHLFSLLPRRFILEDDSGRPLARISQRFGLIVQTYEIVFIHPENEPPSRELSIAALMLLLTT